MGQRVHKRTNDGNFTGIKQDKFRNSDFEFEDTRRQFEGVSRATANTINGKWAENRGRRGDNIRLDNPFENGELENWNRRQGWDEYFETRGTFRGRGPRGYVRQDSRIHDDICNLLTLDETIDASQIEVNVKDGVVTLSGKVNDRSMKKYATHIIERVPGIMDIHNILEFDRR